MGRITRAEVDKIAHLARVDLSPEEQALFTTQLESILRFMEKLSEVDIQDVEPFLNAAAGENVFRADEVAPSLPRDQGLANAPQQGDGFFRVPKVIE